MISRNEALERVRELKRLFDPCELCPRKCRARRLSGEVGVCGAGSRFRIASWAAHKGEEPPISGTLGSGTLFASHCPMKCQFCQNFPFSQLGNGQEMETPEIVKTIQKLAKKGVHNLNLVTHTQFLPQIFEAILEVRDLMPPLPIVYNTSGYERLEVLQLLEGLVDIYLPDMRYADNQVAAKFSRVADYVEHDRAAIREMFRQVGFLRVNERDLGEKGLIVRHLVLPNRLAGTADSLNWLKNSLGDGVHLSLMCQYFPAHRAHESPELNRKTTDDEYLEAIRIVEDLGFENVWAQDPFEEGGA